MLPCAVAVRFPAPPRHQEPGPVLEELGIGQIFIGRTRLETGSSHGSQAKPQHQT